MSDLLFLTSPSDNALIIKKFHPLKDEIKSIPNYNEMREMFVDMVGELQSEYEDKIDTDFDTYIDNLMKDKVDGKTIIDRSNRKIRIDR